MSRTMLDEAIAAALNDCVQLDREEVPRPRPRPRCSRCGTPGHNVRTCSSHDVMLGSRGAEAASRATPEDAARATPDEACRATPEEIARLDELIALQHHALAQHRSAVRHWMAVGDEDRTEAALWRADYVGGLLAQLQVDRVALGAQEARDALDQSRWSA